MCDDIVRDGDCRADAGRTSATAAATSNADSAYHDAGNTVTDRIRPSSDCRAREKRTDPDTRDDTTRTCRRNGRYEGDRTALHVERECRPGLRRMVTQSANVHACKVGDDIFTALTWAARQRKIVVKTCVASTSTDRRGFPGVFRQTAGVQQHEAVDPNERGQDSEER